MTSAITVGMLGCGTVGSGVVRLLRDHADELALRLGARIELGPVAVRDLARSREVEIPGLTDDAQRVVAAPDVDVVIEVMGGLEPAGALVAEALRNGKAVVTANKTLIAARGAELGTLARERGVRLEYEAAVAGAVPIIRPLRESLAGDRVRRVLGILNGTTNFILSAMSEQGASYEEALAEAQRLGYAEADPTADVGGADAAQKAAILASLAFDTAITADDVATEGITGVSTSDIALAARLGYAVKLLGIAEESDGAVGVRVHPALVPLAHPLASVRGAYNAVFIEADAAGSLMFYGQGAGSLPTASAVVGNVVTVARSRLAGERPLGAAHAERPVRPPEEAIARVCIRLEVLDRPGVLAAIAGALGEHGVSIESMVQDGRGETAELVFVTHPAREGDVRATLTAVRALDAVRDVTAVLRVVGGG